MTRHPVPAGYASADYVAALCSFGTPLELPSCGGYLLRRAIPSGGEDACGAYPLFSCCRWSCLEEAIVALPSELVSVAMVIDPFAEITEAELARAFPDRCIPFKTHYVRELTASVPFSAHHRRNIRAAAAMLEVEHCPRPIDHLDDWCRLYGELVARHAITGPAAFSRESFAAQLNLPCLRAFRALRKGRTVGMALWVLGGATAYYHLAAYDEEGYRTKASYALFDSAISRFRKEGRLWLGLGSTAGLSATDNDGLARFKQGWATETRIAWFGGRILDRSAYARLTDSLPSTAYFPAYRAPDKPRKFGNS